MKNLRKYGNAPYKIAVLHGGPGAPGEVGPVAREASTICGTLEPIQTSDSIDGLIHELHTILNNHGELPITLIGHSWGAWLSFMYAARNSSEVKKLILISSPPFETKYVHMIMETWINRLEEKDMLRLAELENALNDPERKDKNETLAEFRRVIHKTDSFDPLPIPDDDLEYNFEIFQRVSEEGNVLRRSGKLLGMAKHIQCPVVAIHGDYDPHPAEGVEKPLTKFIANFRFILLKNCGHDPWLERGVKDRFYEILKEELK